MSELSAETPQIPEGKEDLDATQISDVFLDQKMKKLEKWGSVASKIVVVGFLGVGMVGTLATAVTGHPELAWATAGLGTLSLFGGLGSAWVIGGEQGKIREQQKKDKKE